MRFLALITPADVWQRRGERHPLGEEFRGYRDILPERLDRSTLEDALAAVPFSMLDEAVMWGTPERVAEQLRAFGAAGLRHVAATTRPVHDQRGRAALDGSRARR